MDFIKYIIKFIINKDKGDVILNDKQSIKAITEGAIFTAIYGILAIISRYLLMGTDSLLYYFTPLPISLYIAKNKLSYSITVLFASILLSFLF